MAPELRLSVGLDLAFFRQQMRKAVNIAQSEFTAQLQVKFNRQILNNELRNLDRAIKRKKFNVELNLVGGLTGRQFDQIQERLDALAKRDAVEIPVSIRAAASQDEISKTVAQLNRSIKGSRVLSQTKGKIQIGTTIRPAITVEDATAFKQEVQRKLSGISAEIPVGIRVAASQDEVNKTVAQLNRSIKGSRALSEAKGKLEIGATIRPAITVKDVTAFKQEVQSKLSGISVKVKAELAGDIPAASQAQTPQASTTRTGTFRQRLTALGKESKENLQALYRAAGEAGILAFDEAIVNNKDKMISALNQAGEDSVQGLLNGLKSKEKSVGDAAKKLGKKLIASIKAELGIASPSKEFMEIGKDAGEGLEIGLIGYLQLIKNRATKEMRGIVAAVRFEAMKLGDINFGARAGVGPSSIAGRAGILPPAGMGRIDLNARQMPTRMPGVASSTGATGAMSMLPSSAIETYRMAGAQLALSSTEMRAAAAAAKSQERVAEAGRELTRSLREAAAAIPRRPGLGIRHMGTGIAGYTSPIGPLPTGSAEPWSPGSRGMYGGGGFEPFMNARLLTERVAIQGTQAFRAPAIGEQFKKVNEAFKKTQPIANHLREAAIAFSKDAPIVAQYLNSFRARKINISDLPGAGESPGQYIRRIQEAFRQGPFGAGTVPAGGGGGFAFGQGPQVPGYPVQRALPPAGMTTAAGGPNYPFDRVTGAGGGGGGGGRGGAIVPYAPRTELPPGYLTGGKIQQALKGADQYLKQSRVPLTGAIQELGAEFGNAVKQVLLFGTAYKALAFIIDIPNQALAAATALQSFRNQIQALTPNAVEAERAFAFIEDIAQEFKVPLDAARQGFVRLYASMEPAGIPTDVIEGLFIGISKAAATLDMSEDKVNRVIYAFSQMASKGKLSAEEVTNQLGDVIPGALSLMANSAQMEMSEFIKAMENGQLSGEAVGQVMNNVAVVLDERFGKGAKGAANSLRGLRVDLQNNTKLMYEAFTPLVDIFASRVFPVLNAAIKDATSAIKAFGKKAQGAENPTKNLSDGALKIYTIFLKLEEISRATIDRVRNLIPLFAGLGTSILFAADAVAKFVNTPIGGALADLAIQATIAISALQGISKLIETTKTVTASLKGLFAVFGIGSAVALAKVALIVGAVVGIGAAIKKLYDSWEPFNDAVDNSGRFAGAFFDEFINGTDGIANQWQKSVENMSKLWNGFIGGASSAFQGLSDFFNRISGFIQSVWNNTIVANVNKAREGSELINSVFEGISNFFSQVTSFIRKNWANMLSAMVNAAANTLNPLAATFKALFNIDIGKATTSALRAAASALQGGEEQGAPPEEPKSEAQPRSPLSMVDVELGGEDGKGGKGGKGSRKELKDYDADLQQFYDNEFKTRSAAIEQDFNLTKREKELAIAREKFRTDELKAQAQYNRDLGKLQEYKPDQRAFAKAGLDIEKQQRLDLAAIDFTRVALGETTKEAENQAEAQEKLRTQIKLLSEGREELTEVEKVENLIKKETKGLDEEIVKGMQEKHNTLRKSAVLTDNLRQEVEKLIEAEKARKEIEQAETTLQNRLSMARAILPGQEIRENLRQQLGASATPEKIEELAQLEELAIKAEEIKALYQNVAQTIGDAFGQAFQDVVNGSKGMQEALSSMLQSIGQSFVAMAAQIIAKQITMITLGAIMKALGLTMGGSSGAAAPLKTSSGAAMTAGQATEAGFGMGASLAGGTSAANPGFVQNQTAISQYMANGGVLAGGFKAFANGGVVNGPTLGLVGEGRYNEAIVPLPDGKSIPVQMRNQQSSRELLSAKEQREKMSPTVLSMNFETTNINGVEYVSREQLEQAMAQTRKEAAREGASQGSRLTLDKIKNSPSTRRQLGIR